MTYRHDSEVFNGYGAFVNKTSRKEIKLNGFLQFDRKYQSVDSNLRKFKIAELSERPKGSNFSRLKPCDQCLYLQPMQSTRILKSIIDFHSI